jgi:hypothetical protein
MHIASLALLVMGSSMTAAAQEKERRTVVGIRSGLIAGAMDLSTLDPAFAKLESDGPSGPHMSGFYLLVSVRSHVRVGIETLVSNADAHERTTMNYQAAGPVAEVRFGRRWFVSGGVHGGGVIVNAMSRPGSEPARGATVGSYFKGSGGFIAPYADAGRRFRRSEVSVYAKRVNMVGEQDRGGLSGFNATFVGLRLGIRM